MQRRAGDLQAPATSARPRLRFWKPVFSRTPRCDLDALSTFSVSEVYCNTVRGATHATNVRAEPPGSQTKSLPAKSLRHTCYEDDHGFPYQDDLVDVRFLQLTRDVAHFLHMSAFEGQQPRSPLKVHAATVVLLKHLGFTAAVPHEALVVLYVWDFAGVQHPVFRKKRLAASRPWHTAVTSGLGEV